MFTLDLGNFGAGWGDGDRITAKANVELNQQQLAANTQLSQAQIEAQKASDAARNKTILTVVIIAVAAFIVVKFLT